MNDRHLRVVPDPVLPEITSGELTALMLGCLSLTLATATLAVYGLYRALRRRMG